jgi:hypothetical protein
MATINDLRDALVEMRMQTSWVLQHCREDATIHEALDGELALKMKAVTDIALDVRTPPVAPRSLGWSEKGGA